MKHLGISSQNYTSPEMQAITDSEITPAQWEAIPDYATGEKEQHPQNKPIQKRRHLVQLGLLVLFTIACALQLIGLASPSFYYLRSIGTAAGILFLILLSIYKQSCKKTKEEHKSCANNHLN